MLLRYIELKSGYCDDGPAWIGYVRNSKSGRTIYFDGKAFRKGFRGSYFDLQTDDNYWISGVKRRGTNRHYAGKGKITIEATAINEYLRITGAAELDRTKFIVTESFRETDPAEFYELENKKLS